MQKADAMHNFGGHVNAAVHLPPPARSARFAAFPETGLHLTMEVASVHHAPRRESHSMKLAIIIFVLFAFAFSASALDLATRDGRVFENARVVRVEPDGITVRHSAGLEKIPARLLSDEDRERYGLTPEAAREYAAKRREAVARRERDLQSAEALAVRDAELQKHAKNYLLFCIQCDEDGVLSRDRHNWHFIIHGFKATPGTWFNLYAAPLGIEPFGSFEHPCELVPLTPPPDRKPSHAPGLDKTGH